MQFPSNVSPKAVAAFLAPIIAAVVIAVLYGDDSYLKLMLLSLVTGPAAAIAPPAPGVKQRQVERLRRR